MSLKYFLLTVTILLSPPIAADQEVVVQDGARGLIRVRINAAGQIRMSAEPNLNNLWNKVLRPDLDPVDVPLFRNLIRIFDETRILKALVVTELMTIRNQIYAVAHEPGLKDDRPSYLVQVRVRYLTWPDLIHLSLPGGALALTANIGFFPSPKIGIAVRAIGVGIGVFVAAKFLRETVANLKSLTGGAHPVGATEDFVRVDQIVFENGRIKDLFVSPLGQTLGLAQSLTALLNSCDRSLDFLGQRVAQPENITRQNFR